MTNPSLVLTFLGNDLEAGHSTTQTISNQWLVNHSYQPSKQLLNGLKSSSDQIALTIFRKCPSVEDIIATEGNIKAALKDGDTVVFTGFISTNHNFVVTDHGEQALAITIESIGTRLFSQPFIETGYHFFDTQASAAVYAMIAPLGLSFREGDERKILQPIRREVEAGKTVRELMDSLFYECNAVYWFNNLGELCVEPINPSTSGASVVDSAHLFHLNGKAISLSKSLRTYKGARVRYTETAEASNYLVYRNTTGADDSHPYCNLKLGAGEWYDGGEIYTNAEWSAATADQFREPLLISAVNAGSETEIVGSGKIVAISNAKQKVTADSGITVQIEAVGGKWFKITCHNTSGVDKYITRLDLYADIVYEKTQGIIRTQIDGSTEGKSLLEEELSWIHDKDNAQRHGNLLAQYYKNCGATYTFYSDLTITLGSVIRLIDDTFSGLDVYVLVYASKGQTASELTEYKAVGISTFNLDEPTYHGTSESGSPTGKQGAKGEAGASTEVQYAIGTSLTEPPSSVITWQNEPITWNGEPITWNSDIYSDSVPPQERGKYIWMRTRVGDAPWQYTRLTGSQSWDAEALGVALNATPTQSKSGLGLIPGDCFVAGNTFTENGKTYNAGWAYAYNGSTWVELDLSDDDNAHNALDLLTALSTAGIQIPESDSIYSEWMWAKNFVAQNAIFKNLKAIDALFETIHVTGDSSFDGNIDSDALSTESGTSSGSFSISTGSTKRTCTWKSGSQSGTTVERYCIAKTAVTLADGTYYAISGTITYNGITYSASYSNRIKITVSNEGEVLRIIPEDISLPSIIYKSSNYSQYIDAPDGYLCGDTLTTDVQWSLNVSFSDSAGIAYTHDLMPKDTAIDSVGTHDKPYNDGHFNSLEILSQGGMTYAYGSPHGLGSIGVSGNHGNAIEEITVQGNVSDYSFVFICGVIWNLSSASGVSFSTPLIPISAISDMLGDYNEGADYEFHYEVVPDFETSSVIQYSTAIGFAFKRDRTKLYIKPHLRYKTSPATVYQSYDVNIYGIK